MSQSQYYRALERAQQLLAAERHASGHEQARRLRRWVDKESAERATLAGWDCRVGCDHCCRHPVGVTFVEAQLLAAAIEASADAERERLTRRVVDAARATAQTQWDGLTDQPCPLLDEQGACSLYAERPIPCRALGSLDAQACKEPRRHAKVPFDEAAFLTGLAAGAHLADELGHRELRSALAAILQAGPDGARGAFATARSVGIDDPAGGCRGRQDDAGTGE
ncbi:MAG: YkgJ family cysteine cluster protein [Planctomycetota bacterium]|nr:YkgJ family cysteine cluster protein [Planctomycetota bacterium]